MTNEPTMERGVESTDEIVARPATYYRMTRYIVVALVIGFGGWFLYDGFIGYPSENEQIARLEARLTELEQAQPRDEAAIQQITAERRGLKHRTELDILIQKVLGIALPPIGLLLLGWFLYNSRGVYRLSDGVLSAPGHPPVSLDEIRQLDKRLWDRKGIAFVDYEHEQSGTAGRLKLDDFIYEREPTDAIFERINAHLESQIEDDTDPPQPRIEEGTEA